MVFKDVKGLYTIEVDLKRNLVREQNTGFWQKEDIERFQKDYEKQVLPILKGKSWAKYSDLRTYKASDIGDKVSEHMAWAIKNGLKNAAMIVESNIVKRQMNNTVSTDDLQFQAFTDEKEADDWLKTKGF